VTIDRDLVRQAVPILADVGPELADADAEHLARRLGAIGLAKTVHLLDLGERYGAVVSACAIREPRDLAGQFDLACGRRRSAQAALWARRPYGQHGGPRRRKDGSRPGGGRPVQDFGSWKSCRGGR
jgi:hypothetical protein